MTEKAHDQVGTDPSPPPAIRDGVPETSHEHLEADAPPGVALGIEEDLGMAHRIVGGPVEVGSHEVVEVIGGAKDLAAVVVNVEERLEVGESVGGMDLFDVLERERQL